MQIQEVTGELLQRSEPAYVSLVTIVGGRTYSFYVDCPVRDDAPQYFFARVTADDAQQADNITRYMTEKVVLDADGKQPEFLYLGMESVLVRFDSVEHIRASRRDFIHR